MLQTTETWMPLSGTYKTYACDVVISYWEEGTTVWSKGHHPSRMFAEAAVARWLEEDPGFPTPQFLRDPVEREWWATRMWGGMTGPHAEYSYMHNIVDPWANGAYPVTVVRA